MDVTIVAAGAEHAATFAATAATLLVPHFWCHNFGATAAATLLVPQFWCRLCATLHVTLCATLVTDLVHCLVLSYMQHVLYQQVGLNYNTEV